MICKVHAVEMQDVCCEWRCSSCYLDNLENGPHPPKDQSRNLKFVLVPDHKGHNKMVLGTIVMN